MRKKKILIIDDTELFRYLSARQLTLAGFDPVTASNAEEGLAIARSQPIRMILLDIMMPGMNGFEMLMQLKKDPATTSIPVIVVTALHTKSDADAQVHAGATKIVSKPVDWKALLPEMKRILGTAIESEGA